MNTDLSNSILKTDLNSDGILKVVLNNPKSGNTLSEKMMSSLQIVLDDAAIDKKVRVIIIASEGSVFSAGHDLKEIRAERLNSDKGKSYFTQVLLKCSSLMQSIVNNPKPVIAEVAGIATAAGCQLVASCDLAYASTSARFATPGVNIGLFCSTPMVALSRNISNKHSMEMLLTGELISSQKASQIGLINEVIAEVAGIATAAGCQLVASCDLAYASTSARFATPGVNIGLFCSTPMVALSRNISNKHSMEMLLTGELISSQKASQIGLINESVKDETLQKFVLERATTISKKSTMTLKTGKIAFYKQLNMSLPEAYQYASGVMLENMLQLDAEEGINAFLEKRSPNWQD